MTKKDYKLIAKALKTARATAQCDILGNEKQMQASQDTMAIVIGELIVNLEADNPRFDGDVFRQACKYPGEK